MKPARIMLLIVALVAGGLAAFLVTRGGSAPEQVASTEVVEQAKAQILVARNPIGVGERLSPESVQWQDWPEGALRPEYVTISAMPDAPVSLTGAVVRFEFFPGEPIREAKLVRADQGYLSAVLAEGMRGVSVGVTAVSSAGGFVVPNDHVDVLLTPEGQPSKVILSNVRVLAIGQRLGELGTTGGQEDPNTPATTPVTFTDATIATLELTPAQAETLVNASTVGDLSLTLRSVVDFKKSTADALSSNQTVRLIRFGKEQSIQSGNAATVADQQVPAATTPTYSAPVMPSVAPPIDPASVPL
ncbi:Flp pilus assembly protein CpaB [Devosia psychrophila]|uniref:Pilus assembly protein CpaB n=1 Tax=Devosia psychrophila TaxID=728005 RepID=A0A1I1MAV5_9HYPH|nr:Flp pilus assembly protein CpaB [Devosia psychrophila]SFC82484.1 pilus assembly protein CpaB [Devosia psychrophila]